MPPSSCSKVFTTILLCSGLVAAQVSTTAPTTAMPSTTTLPNATTSTPTNAATSTTATMITTQSPPTATTTVVAATDSPTTSTPLGFSSTTFSPATTTTTTTVAPPRGFSSPPSNAGSLSPLYADLVPFSNADAASLVATVLSGISGHPLTSCHVWRAVTLLTVCRGTSHLPLSSSSVPISVAVGSRPETRYYAGASYLNCALFASIALLTAIASLILAKSKGRSWRRMFVVGHYPQLLLFPFFYFFQTGISTSTTVVVFDDNVLRRVFSGLTFVFWAGLPCAACAVLYSQVHLKAIFVKRFRDVSQEAEVEKVLFRRLVQLEKENEEHERRAAKLRMEAEREKQQLARQGAGGDDSALSVTTGKAEVPANQTAAGADTATETDGGTEMTSITRIEGGIGALTGFSLRKLFNANFIPEAEEDELIRNTEKYLEAAVRADDAEKERLRRATNLVYSKMLASQIQATAFDDFAVQQTLTGRDRWEDRQEAAREDGTQPDTMLSAKEQQEDEDFLSLEQQAKFAVFVPAPIADYLTSRVNTGAVGVSRTGYLNMWGGFFRGFHESAFMFIALEFFVSFCAGMLDGWKPSDALGSSCYVQASLLFVLYGGYFTAIVILRPYLVPLEAGLVFITSCLLTVGGALLVAAVVNSSSTAAVAANVLGVCCIYLFVLKSLLDVFTMLAPFLYAHERPWPTAKLTEYYFDTARETSDASFYEKKQLLREKMNRSSSRREDSSSTKSPRRSRAGSMQSAGHQPRSTSPGKTTMGANSIVGGGGGMRAANLPSGAATDSSQAATAGDAQAASRAGSGEVATVAVATTPSPGRGTASPLDYRVVDVIENEAVRYRAIGGRRNAYVTSRGVPEALHPFHLVPLPGIIPLPSRDPMHMTLRQRRAKLASERSRALFGARVLETSNFLTLDEEGGDGGDDNGGGDQQGAQSSSATAAAAARQTWSKALDFLKEEQDRHESRRRQREAKQLSTALVSLSRGEGTDGASFGSSSLARTATAVDRSSAGKTSSGGTGSAVGAAAGPPPMTLDAMLDLEDDPLVITDLVMVRRGLSAIQDLPTSAVPSRTNNSDDDVCGGGGGGGVSLEAAAHYSPTEGSQHHQAQSSSSFASPLRSDSSGDELLRPSAAALASRTLPKGISAAPPQQHAPEVVREALGQRVVSLLRVTGTGVDANSVEALRSAGARHRRMMSSQIAADSARTYRSGERTTVWTQALPVHERRRVHFAASSSQEDRVFSSGSPAGSGFSVEL